MRGHVAWLSHVRSQNSIGVQRAGKSLNQIINDAFIVELQRLCYKSSLLMLVPVW
jgi:surface antigen